MYAQFRAQYPTGSLTSELLQAEADRYIVRALVRVGEITLASGFAAAPTIEEAEDQARQRALVVLGVESISYEAQAHLLSAAHGQDAPARLQPAMGMEDLDQLSLEESMPAGTWDMAERPEPTVAHPQQRSSPTMPPAVTQAEPSAKTVADNGDRRAKKSTSAQDKNPPSAAPKSSTGKSVAPQEMEPLDLSDILAQTDVELKRLGWTSAQGRKYLQQTYDKRSRQHLTDDELLEFLDFLQAQMTEDEAPF